MLSSTNEVVEFLLSKQLFAINLFDVKEVIEYPNITKVPNSDPWIKGIIDLRGEIATVIDLKSKMNISSSTETIEENFQIIILDENKIGSKIGIVVDNVLSVSVYADENIDRNISSSKINDTDDEIIGVIKKKIKEEDLTQLIILIDIKKVLESRRADKRT
jgi:purine-binding chemotaxis protein CheW